MPNFLFFELAVLKIRGAIFVWHCQGGFLMKRALAVIMAVLLTVGFAGCNNTSKYKSGDNVSRRGPSVSAADESEIESEDETESESLFASHADESSSEEESEPSVSSAEESSTASKSDTKTNNDFSLTPKSV